MEIVKHLKWYPDWRNEIDINHNNFTLTLGKDQLEIDHDAPYEGNSGMSIDLKTLKQLIEELENSEKPDDPIEHK